MHLDDLADEALLAHPDHVRHVGGRQAVGYHQRAGDLDNFTHSVLPFFLPHTGPKKERGTFSTRSPHRPNPIALSVVKVRSIDYERGEVLIDSIEAQDGTPILDIKPYSPKIDAVPDALTPNWEERTEEKTKGEE